MVVTKWSPIAEEEQPEMTSIPLWVIVKNVPHRLFSWEGLSVLTSPLGKPQRLHPDTEACKIFEEAKVFVEVDLTKKLPKCFSFTSDHGVNTVVEYIFPRLPPRYSACSKWVHVSKDCVISKQITNEKERSGGVVLHVNATKEVSEENVLVCSEPMDAEKYPMQMF